MDLYLNETTGLPNTYDYINNMSSNPLMIIILVVVMVVYYFVFASVGAGEVAATTAPASKSFGTLFVELLLWGSLIALFLLNGIKYFYDIDIVASIKNILSGEPEIDITIDNVQPEPEPVPEITREKQVFHLKDNEYTYDDANAVCKAFGGRLADYDEVEKAYDNGAEWCGYGWSADQLALFPTQKATYERLQKTKGHENDCGRPGINGGFIGNKNVRFGVNCYGYKPKITPQERELMALEQPFPKTKSEIAIGKKIEEWKQKLPQVLVSPFNRKTWSRF